MAAEHIEHLKSLLSENEIIPSSSEKFKEESLPWAIQKDLKPTLVIRPATIESLSKTIAYLSKTNLDFAVRSQGFGSASAKDVLISLTAFDQFELDRENEVLTLGAGQSWGDYYKKMEKAAPELTVVACRTPVIGVGGSTLCAGFSWLSAEHGCVSDPTNLLDAQIVKLDGTVMWASEEPELLWALRGSSGGFGVVTAFKFRTLSYTQRIWAGPILLPNTQEMLKKVAKGIVSMDAEGNDPKVAMFLYLMPKEVIETMGGNDEMLVVHAFDANGEQHGREAFAWALNMEGAMDMTSIKNLRGVSDMQESIGAFKGTKTSYWAPMIIPRLTEDVILKSFEWYSKLKTVGSEGSSIRDSGYLIFELFCTRDSLTSRADSAWPRPRGFKHQVLIGAGTLPDASAEEDALAQQLVKDGPDFVFGDGANINIIPNAVESFHSVEAMYAEHYPKLQALKRKYDPDHKLKGVIKA